MILVGCDFHSRYQQIACVDTDTGDLIERRLEHENGEARAFYSCLPRPARVGVEATSNLLWFGRMLAEFGHELIVGNAGKIRAMVVRRQKTDSRDASHLLDLLMNNRFPEIWVPTPVEHDLRQLLWHRQKLVWQRTSVKNQLHGLAMGEGVCRKTKLWNAKGRKEIESLALGPWAGRRRDELLRMLDGLDQSIEQLDAAVEECGKGREDIRRLMTHPGVGRIVAMAFALMVGPVHRFPNSKHLVSYLGLNPTEHSSGGRQKFGRISKQGNRLMRSLLVEAAQTAARVEPELRRHYQRLKFRSATPVAKVAVARKLAVRWYWMLRSQTDYVPLIRMQGSPGVILVDKSASLDFPLLLARGIHVQVVTSAFRPWTLAWASLPHLNIVVSIDGLQPEHDLRRSPATYERILKNIAGQKVTIHCTITGQMMKRPGYLNDFLEFWTPRPEINKVWFSLFTPQKGDQLPEMLDPAERIKVISELSTLRKRFTKLDMPEGLIRQLAAPPHSPEDCIFALTTETLSADLRTKITPCLFGGNPDCESCGCVASMGLAAVAAHKLGGVVPVGKIFKASVKIGQARSKSVPPPTVPPGLRVLQ